MLILIIDSKTALEGVQDGIRLCLITVIPSLFPFFVLSCLLTSSLLGTSFSWLSPLGKFCGLPKGSEALLITGFLGGYPVGAQSVGRAYQNGNLCRKDAQRLLAFTNNAGPAFLFGMIGSVFPKHWMAWALWGIHISSALLTAFLIPKDPHPTGSLPPRTPVSFPEAVKASLFTMAIVCGWVVIFRVVITFLRRWILWLLPGWAQITVCGLLELTNGCCMLATISDISIRFVICAGLLASGGLSVAMQTASVTQGLSLKFYVIGKLSQTMISLAAATAMAYQTILPLGGILILVILSKSRNKGSIHAAAGV